MQAEKKANRYVKPTTGFFEKNKVTLEAPRLLDYLSSTLGVLERLKNGDLDAEENKQDMRVEEKQDDKQARDSELARLVSAITLEITSSGKDLHALCCHPEASMLLEAFLDWTAVSHLHSLATAFAQVKPGMILVILFSILNGFL
jgi:hypothetical protein